MGKLIAILMMLAGCATDGLPPEPPGAVEVPDLAPDAVRVYPQCMPLGWGCGTDADCCAGLRCGELPPTVKEARVCVEVADAE
jgi:hypothetical protein